VKEKIIGTEERKKSCAAFDERYIMAEETTVWV
jgi:hypothetical protein